MSTSNPWPRLALTLLLMGLIVYASPGAYAAGAADALPREPGAGIRVQGVGEVAVNPDLARVHLEVRREGADATELMRALDAVVAAVLERARAEGVDERDVVAAAVSLYPRQRQEGDAMIQDGVIASRSMSVTVRNLDRLPGFVNAVIGLGINGINGIELDVADRAAHEQAALDRAIDAARQEAARVAGRFGVAAGTLLSADTAGAAGPGPFLRMEALATAAPNSFAPGTLRIRREVIARFAIAPPPG